MPEFPKLWISLGEEFYIQFSNQKNQLWLDTQSMKQGIEMDKSIGNTALISAFKKKIPKRKSFFYIFSLFGFYKKNWFLENCLKTVYHFKNSNSGL